MKTCPTGAIHFGTKKEMLELWKGALKPLAAAGFIATFAGLIFHYIGIGPNKEVDDDEEDHHE